MLVYLMYRLMMSLIEMIRVEVGWRLVSGHDASGLVISVQRLSPGGHF